MVPERLMCVWQAMYAKNGDSGPNRETLKDINEAIGAEIQVNLNGFDSAFHDRSEVSYDSYKTFLLDQLTMKNTTLSSVVEGIERVCWEICDPHYPYTILRYEDGLQMWRVFNRLCVEASYPPVMGQENGQWLVQMIETKLPQLQGRNLQFPDAKLRYEEVIERLERGYFKSVEPVDCWRCVQEIHRLLVKEILKAGWLHKRTKKNGSSSFSSWAKRWVVLAAGKLAYYDTPECKNLRAEVVVDDKSEIESLADYSGMIHKLTGRFKVANQAPAFEIELAGVESWEKREWLAGLYEMSIAAKEGTTPISKLIWERAQLAGENQ